MPAEDRSAARRRCRHCGHAKAKHKKLNLAGGMTTRRCFEGLCNCHVELRGLLPNRVIA